MTREEATNHLKDILAEATETEHAVCYVTNEDAEALEMAIEALKEQKTGKWINCKYPLGECSECHAIVDIQNNEANYCPVCGSKNRGKE